MEGLDSQGNSAARRLVTLLSSREAKRILLRVGVLTSLSLCTVAWVVSYTASRPLEWSFDAEGALVTTLLFGVLSVFNHYHFLLRWAFRSWSTMNSKPLH